MLPQLRQELSLHPGPHADDGSPTWTLHDPAVNKFYRLGWLAFEMLSRWHLGHEKSILAALRNETTAQANAKDIKAMVEFLTQHSLIATGASADTERLKAARKAAQSSRWMWLLKNYLFFRLPLVHPMPLLNRLAPHVRWAFDARFWILIGATALLGLYLVSRQWDSFIHTFSGYATWQGWLAIGGALMFAKILHEFGHAFTAHRYGCRVPTMGVAFLVLMPMLYTDTNEAWKLAPKKQRLTIASAGMLSELALAAIATLLWSFLPDGPLRAAAFLLATTTWIMTLAINVSPFMRFDGYFILSDWMNMPNLHSRSFAMGRWWLRERLFGWGDPVPEVFSPRRHTFLIAFAFGVWVYRLVLFLGIALLVYHLFFKLLGIILLIVELAWFIGKPIMSELKIWWKRRADMRFNTAARRTLLLLLLGIGIVVIPWNRSIDAPAVIGAQQEQGIYAIAAAQVETPPPPLGTRVEAGQEIMRLTSPDLTFSLAQAEQRERLLAHQVAQQSLQRDMLQENAALRERWAETMAEVAGLREQAALLTIRAPFAGTLVERTDGLLPAAWVAKGEKLFRLVRHDEVKVDAFITQDQLNKITLGSSARFTATAPDSRAIDCTISAIDTIQLSELQSQALASIYGGPIAVQRDRRGALIPTQSWFRVRLDQCATDARLALALPGTARLDAQSTALITRVLRRTMAALQKEAGF